MTGEYTDYLVHADGRREPVGEGKNIVVNTAYLVLALALKQTPGSQALYWAVGDGNLGATSGETTTWDNGVTAGTTHANTTDAVLLRETFRKLIAPTDITFVDSVGNPSVSPTNRLQISVTLGFAEPVGGGKLREFGIFGGSTDSVSSANPNPISASLNTGYLVNHKLHKTYDKTVSVQLQRVLTFTV